MNRGAGGLPSLRAATVERVAWWRGPVLPCLAALVAQCLLVAHAFPLSQVLSATPMLGIDHPFHLYQLKVALALAELGRLTGYDPFFGAGYVGGVNFNASAKAPALLAWLLGGVVSAGVAYKLYVASVAVLAPVLVTVAAVAARLSTRQVWCCAGLAIGLWWASAFHWYHTAGLVSFVFVSFAALPYCVALNRLFDAPQAWRLTLALGIAGALLFLVHPFFSIPVVFFALARLLVQRPGVSLPGLALRLFVVAALCIVPNLPWLWAMTGQAGIGPSRYSVAYQMLVDHRLVWKELLGLTSDPAKGAKVYPMLAVLALCSLRIDAGPMRGLCRTLVLCWLALVLFAAFGAALPFIGPVQPNRFSTTAYLFLVVPAAVGTGVLARALREWRMPGRLLAWAAAGIVVVLGLAAADEVRREASQGAWGRYGSAPPEVRGIGPKGQALISWLRTDTTPEGRVLFETSLGRIHDGGHIAGYLALQVDREFIGGPYNNFFAGTRDGWMFGRPLAEIEPAAFIEYLKLYNIGWIAVHSPQAKRYLDRVGPPLQRGATFEGLQTYRVDQPLDFVQSGRAIVRSRAYGKLVVEQRGEPGETIVLKYHHVSGLRALDGSLVEPVYLLDDPDPFIKVTPRGAVVELVR